MRPPLNPHDVARISVGPEKMRNVSFTNWEALLSEIIIGDALGVDRMDYLLRDSHHAGVAYGNFDHHRLVDTMRILPDANEESEEPTLGVESGGIHSSEALLLARYFMFVQVYHHHVRVAYDFHLKQFLQAWLSDGRFSTEANAHQKLTDNEVLVEIASASHDPSSICREAADRIVNRKHFRHLYTPTREDKILQHARTRLTTETLSQPCSRLWRRNMARTGFIRVSTPSLRRTQNFQFTTRKVMWYLPTRFQMFCPIPQ